MPLAGGIFLIALKAMSEDDKVAVTTKSKSGRELVMACADWFLRSVADSERHPRNLCTESASKNYVRKIEDGTVGAGFEHALMMGQLMPDLGTSRFIPVIRQTRSPHELIPGLATLYVDLSEGVPFPERVQELARGAQATTDAATAGPGAGATAAVG